MMHVVKMEQKKGVGLLIAHHDHSPHRPLKDSWPTHLSCPRPPLLAHQAAWPWSAMAAPLILRLGQAACKPWAC